MRPRRVQAVAFLVLCTIWGSTRLAIKEGLERGPPLFSASVRFAVAAVVLLILVRAFRKVRPKARSERGVVPSWRPSSRSSSAGSSGEVFRSLDLLGARLTFLGIHLATSLRISVWARGFAGKPRGGR